MSDIGAGACLVSAVPTAFGCDGGRYHAAACGDLQQWLFTLFFMACGL